MSWLVVWMAARLREVVQKEAHAKDGALERTSVHLVVDQVQGMLDGGRGRIKKDLEGLKSV